MKMELMKAVSLAEPRFEARGKAEFRGEGRGKSGEGETLALHGYYIIYNRLTRADGLGKHKIS